MTISTTPSANDIQSTFRLKGIDPRIGPLKPFDGSQSAILQKLSRDIHLGQAQCTDVLLTTGLGLSDNHEVPLRLPALLVPGFQAMERQKALGFTPSQYRVYQATEFIADANGIELQKAREVSSRMEHFLRRYVEELHPYLVEHVEFCFERDQNETASDSIAQLVTEISDSTSHEIFDRLSRCESSHSNRNGQAIRYGAANVLYNGADPEKYPFKRSTEILLPIGGKAERPFFALTNQIAAKRGADVIPMVTQLGSTPTYYPAPASHATRKDFEALEADGASEELLQKLNPVTL